MLTPAEQIAAATWARMALARHLSVRLGEETLTDILSLDFTRLAGRYPAKLFQSTKHQESYRGTDLEIRIHAGARRAFVVVVQAKKLYSHDRYQQLNRASKFPPLRQIDLLELYARRVRAIPFFLLYNFSTHPNLRPYWHCCKPLDPPQFGCTLVPSWEVRPAMAPGAKKTFSSLHTSSGALPWRCLFECPARPGARFPDRLNDSLADYRRDRHTRDVDPQQDFDWLEDIGPVHNAWPDWLWTRAQPTLDSEDLARLQAEERHLDHVVWIGKDELRGVVPRRLLLVQSSPEED